MTDWPEVRWGSPDSALSRAGAAFASTTAGSWLIRTLTPLDRRLLLRSGGRRTVLGPVGAPMLLLTTTGRKSGQPRTTPLLYGRDGDALVVVGSNFGQQHHPAWSSNLLAHPDAVVTMAGQQVPVRAELLTGAAAEAGYRTMVELAKTYAAYQTRTDRDIRVFRLTRR